VRRAAKNPLAREVKRANLLDNMDPARLAKLPADVQARLRAKYESAMRVLAETPMGEPGGGE
jgi:hypothetical protein